MTFLYLMGFLGFVCAGIVLAIFLKERKPDISQAESTVDEVQTAEFMHLRAQAEKPIVALFFADWCKACASQTKPFRRVAKELDSVAKFVAINTDRDKALSNRMEIAKIPVIMVFDGTNPPIAKHVGVLEDDQLLAFIEKALATLAVKDSEE